MAIAEYDVVIQRDAMSVYDFLLDARNLRLACGIRSIELKSGAAGPRAPSTGGPSRARAGARSRGLRAHRGAARGGDPVQALAGPERTHGGYYLSTEAAAPASASPSTRAPGHLPG